MAANTRKIVQRATNGFLGNELHPVLQRIYAARHVESTDSITYGLNKLLSPDDLPGIGAALEILEPAIEADARILFIGDFDADGATSSALGVIGLREMGARYVSYLVPNRFDYGYGLTPEIVDVAATCEPDVIITVDNGIASNEGVSRAKEYGISVIITDHHLPGEQLPDADAIVNPLLSGSKFQSTALAGVGVIFYVIIALRSALRNLGWFKPSNIPEPNLLSLSDLVALGTVADVVPLDYNNRILVANGLKRINSKNCRPGIRALLQVAGRDIGNAVASDLGYVVGPRLNAAGRLEDISVGIECLLTDSDDAARKMAFQLDKLNSERRTIEANMREQALAIVENLELDDELPLGLCLYQEDWHQGIVGLIAGRIKDKTERPTIVFAATEKNELKGSARSTSNVHIRDALNTIATRNPGMIDRFGGHAAAAGLSIRPEYYDAFKCAFEEHMEELLGKADVWVTVYTDGQLDDEELSIDFAELLRQSGPWGQGFPEPIFNDEFKVIEKKIVGENHLKMRLCKITGNTNIDAIAFNQAQTCSVLSVDDVVRCVYRLDVNEYQGMRMPQLVIDYMEPI